MVDSWICEGFEGFWVFSCVIWNFYSCLCGFSPSAPVSESMDISLIRGFPPPPVQVWEWSACVVPLMACSGCIPVHWAPEPTQLYVKRPGDWWLLIDDSVSVKWWSHKRTTAYFFSFSSLLQDINKRLSLPADIRLPEGYLEKFAMNSPPFDKPMSRRLRRASLVSNYCVCAYLCRFTFVRSSWHSFILSATHGCFLRRLRWVQLGLCCFVWEEK